MSASATRVRALIYHDVTRPGDEETSGFPGPHAKTYKLTTDAFTAHLDALSSARADAPFAAPTSGGAGSDVWVLTFDDGGSSAAQWTADLLEARGWRGYFFVTTGRLDSPGFLSRSGVRDLVASGHVVGTHTVTHPSRMADLSDAALDREWQESRAALSDVLGADVVAGSVPGGLYSARVGASAARAGLRLLFTSEPTTRLAVVGDCTVAGRYSIKRSTSPSEAARLVGGSSATRLAHWLTWNGKKAIKRASPATFRLAGAVLRR